MHPLSEWANVILARMEPNRHYAPEDLRQHLPDSSVHHLHEVMHELWINRQVERVGYGAWRRHRSTPPHASPEVSRASQAVTPEELFDHDTFEDFFK
jgi:hypothetical protein